MSELSVKIDSIDDKVQFGATSRDNEQVVIDYFPPVGNGKGYSSLELLMISFGTCVGTAILTLLRNRKRKNVTGIAIDVDGVTRDEHPKKLEHMQVKLHIKADDLTEEEVREMLKVGEETICPVWAMIKGNVEVDIDVEIEKGVGY